MTAPGLHCDEYLDAIMTVAWRDFILWAADSPDVQAAYKAATGRTLLPPARTTLEAMIDDATGARDASIADFILWVTTHLWGLDDAPATYRQAHQPQSVASA